MDSKQTQAQISCIQLETQDTISLELRPFNASKFSTVEAGSHLDLLLKNGLTRSYSLTNPGDSDRYIIAVKKEASGRGGSCFVHEQLRVGQVIDIGIPRNHFSLNENAELSVLLAGGIGITPVYAMLKRLRSLEKKVHLIYCASSRKNAAFVPQIEALISNSQGLATATYFFSDEHPDKPSMKTLLSEYGAQADYYCCGPTRMLDAFALECSALGYANVHLERFAGAAYLPETDAHGYTAILKKSCREVKVAPGTSLLDSLLTAGIQADFSCKEGVCGACEVRVISGEVEHRDFILSSQEKKSNRSMIICVSGCKSPELVLDL